MRITFDPVKREKALAERGLDFSDAEVVFEGVTLEVEDIRKEYGEVRIIRSLKSDLARVDAHVLKSGEYEELPELTEEMLARACVNKGGRPLSPNPRKLLSLRLPTDVIDRWKATGAGWQTRMAERLSKAP